MRATIVLVDDEPDKRFLLERLLKKEFPENPVASFADCSSAVSMVTAPIPKLVITNGRIGFKDGIEFIAYIHDEVKVPVVVVSLRAELEQKARDAGAFAFVETGNSLEIQKAVSGALETIENN